MHNKPVAVILGGTNPHIALIENLKKRGYYTVLVDYFENPPAKNYADEHIMESTLDKEKVLEIARDQKAALVISACLDQANVTACFVAEKLGLPAPYSYETAILVSNKVLMKEIMIENDIPTAKHINVDQASEVNDIVMNYPVVVKPADSNGSKGVRRADNEAELREYLQIALSFSRVKKAVIEEYLEGYEVSVDCFVQDKHVHVIMMRKKFTGADDGNSVIHCTGSLAPASIDKKTAASIQEIAVKIVNAFNLDNTSLLIQVIIGDDKVNVLEFAPRVGGGLSYRTVKLVTGFDILDATIDSYLGVCSSINYQTSNMLYLTSNIYAKPGIFERVSGHEELLEKGVLKELYYYKTKGMRIYPGMSSSERVGGFIIEASSLNELQEKYQIAINNLSVFDTNGVEIMEKDTSVLAP